MWLLLFCVVAGAALTAEGAGAGAARLVCYVESTHAADFSECTHLVYSGDARGEKLENLLKEYKKLNPRLKIILRVSEIDKDLSTLLKTKNVQGLEIYDAHRSLNKTKVLEMVESGRSAINSAGGGPLFLALPAHPELLAKYYDLRELMKKTDLMIVQTHALGLVKKMTYHPSRLSGLWDMMNTDSVVDLVIGLGVPASKIVISLPATARQFTLLNETLSTPGSPTSDDEPKEIDQAELCRQLQKGRWTLERDQDLSAPYAFKNKTWISFEDASSVDVKGKYARVRGLAGLALHRAERDTDTPCGPTLRTSLTKVLNQQSRAPRAAVLRSLENEILSASGQGRPLDALQVSPYRITQVVDADGVIHSIREDTRTEFSCSRQGYFVHPRSCARFYRCVKFDQYSPDYTVFEFDCPTGLAFDSRYEVCVWPGSLPHSQACPGTSEIAPVPRTRFVCPNVEGFYADPENCRWFFACLDHGKAPLTAYEFRCPFGLGFDAARLKCDWPWLVPDCGNIARYEAEAYGFSGAPLTGALGFQGKTADSVNIAAHESLVSGASLDNLVGIQGGFLTRGDALDSNYITSEELIGGASNVHDYILTHDASSLVENVVKYNNGEANASNGNIGLIKSTNSKNGEQYTSGSLILDAYRLPSPKSGVSQVDVQNVGATESYAQSARVTSSIRKNTGKYDSRFNTGQYRPELYGSGRFNDGKYRASNTGKYVHDPTGDRALPYNHIASPVVPYKHVDYGYTVTNGFDVGRYNGSWSYEQGASVNSESRGYYYPKPTGPAFEEGGYNTDNAGTYKINGYVGTYDDSGAYFDRSGAGDTLTAGAVNVGLVGKTSLVDVGYTGEGAYETDNGQTAQVSYVSHPGVTINHVGTDVRNHDGYDFVTNPTSSGIPTTATPFAVTTALPTVTTYKTTYVPLAPKTSVKQIFGYTQQPVTFVQPTVVTVEEHVTPKIEVTDYNLNINNQNRNKASTYNTGSETTGYDYPRPSVKFQEGVFYSTPAPAISISTYKPQGFSHQQQTIHTVASGASEYSSPVTEQPFKKVVAYTTGPTISSYTQTNNKIDNANVYSAAVDVGSRDYKISDSTVTFEQPQNIVQYTQSLPTVSVQPVVSTYQPQAYSQQTIHNFDASKINSFVQNEGANYQYTKPSEYEERQKTVSEYTTPTPVITSTYRPQAYSQQTIHKVETQKFYPVSSTIRPIVQEQYSYQTTPVTIYENPFLKYTQKATPQTFVSSTYVPQFYRQQTIHKVDSAKAIGIENSGYEYSKTGVNYEQPQNLIQYSTAQPSIPSQSIVSTYQPQSYSQETVHQVDAGQINTYTQDVSGLAYYNTQPDVRSKDASKTVIESSTIVPVVSTTYRPQTFRQRVKTQQFVPVSTTSLPKIELTYQQPAVSVYENPILKYTQKLTHVTYVQPTATVFTETSKPLVQQSQLQYETTAQQGFNNLNVQLNQEGYSYRQPELQTHTGSSKTYSDATAVSHQEFHQSTGNNQYQEGKDVVFVSTTPSTLVYEDHYTSKDFTNKGQTYKNSEYIPKTEYQPTYTVSTSSTPVVYQESSNFYKTQDQYDYKPAEYPQQYDISQSIPAHVSFSQSTVDSPRKISTTVYKQTAYQSPEIQVGYKAEEYLPPVVSSVNPIVTSTYRPTYSTAATSQEYLPGVAKSTYEYNGPEYLPPKPTAKPTTDSREYLPPLGVTTFETKITQNPYSDYSSQDTATVVSSTSTPIYRKQNIVVETAKSNLLGFGSVGPNAGLVTPVTYSTVTPIISSSTNNYYSTPKIVTSTYAPELVEVSTTVPRRSRPKYVRPSVTSTTSSPTYQYVESSTAYKAPDYLPPLNEYEQKLDTIGFNNGETSFSEKINVNPYQEYTISDETPSVVSTTSLPLQRKQNIVVETAKSNLLGFGTVGPDAGLVTYTTSAPISSTGTYPISSKSTYAPVEQELVEVTPSLTQLRRNKPKVAVVTKINDFNPLLVRKLGAVCSCQSPVLVLKGRRPATTLQQNVEDYTDYNTIAQTASVRTPTVNTVVTTTPVVTSTFNPIIVPDDSFYQDYQEASNDNIAIVPNGRDTDIGNYVSSTPVSISTTEKVIRIGPRVKAVTVAPTYKTVLLNQDVSPTVEIKQIETSTDSQSFDRYGPGGWRSRDETLQGSIDCQRAGLFRHPKQCNKFYACRWDCTKKRFTLHVFNCPVQLSFDPNLGACNWPSQGPACQGDTLLTNNL